MKKKTIKFQSGQALVETIISMGVLLLGLLIIQQSVESYKNIVRKSDQVRLGSRSKNYIYQVLKSEAGCQLNLRGKNVNVISVANPLSLENIRLSSSKSLNPKQIWQDSSQVKLNKIKNVTFTQADQISTSGYVLGGEIHLEIEDPLEGTMGYDPPLKILVFVDAAGSIETCSPTGVNEHLEQATNCQDRLVSGFSNGQPVCAPVPQPARPPNFANCKPGEKSNGSTCNLSGARWCGPDEPESCVEATVPDALVQCRPRDVASGQYCELSGNEWRKCPQTANKNHNPCGVTL